MRFRSSRSLARLLVGIAITRPGFAQTSPGPEALKTLPRSEDVSESVAAPEVDQSATSHRRTAGSLTRPQDGVRHPKLDKAWDEYDAIVIKAADRIRAAISKQFEAATAKGDLDAADKWQTSLKTFEHAGEIPTDSEIKSVVAAAASDHKQATSQLTRTYEAVVKALTMEKKIAEAKAARGELAALTTQENATPLNVATRVGKRKPPRQPGDDDGNWISLASTPEEFRKHWQHGDTRGSVSYDPQSSTITIDSPHDLGRLTYSGKWKEFYFELAAVKMSLGQLDMRINGVTFKLGPAAENFPDGVPALVKYDPDTQNATVYFAGRPVAQVAVLDDDWLSTFDCVLSSHGGQNAKIAIRNPRLLEE